MITEQQLDEMARRAIPGLEPIHHYKREAWKKQYRLGEKDIEARAELERKYGIDTAYVGNPSLPAERIQNGLQYQEEMIDKGFKKIDITERPLTPEEVALGYDSPILILNVAECVEHFQHVHALIANTATQQAYRQELEFVQDAITRFEAFASMNGYEFPYFQFLLSHSIQIEHSIKTLEAQFADLEQKIFGTDKPPTDEETAQAGKV